MSQYDKTFFDHTAGLSQTSARLVTAAVQDQLSVRSVLDVGCAEGIWLEAWRGTGVDDFVGLDGDYVNRERLRIPGDRFVPTNLADGFDLGRRFDLVQSLEVAEHIPGDSADRLVASMARHADMILFSAAPPGQGGRNHVNEQPYDYWREKFASHGFAVSDGIRGLLAERPEIAPWYRYNTFLYVRGEAAERLPATLRDALVPDGMALPDISPAPFRVRKAVVRMLPNWVAQALAHLVAWKNRNTAP